MKTSDLEKMLLNADKFDEKILRDNPEPKFSEYIDNLLKERGIKRSELIVRLNLDRVYGHQMLSGMRTPTKHNIILIGLFLGVTLDQMQTMLRICGRESLYIRNIEDAKVMYALEHNYSYEKAIEFINSNEE